MADSSNFYPGGSHDPSRQDSAVPEWMRLVGAPEPAVPQRGVFASIALPPAGDASHATADRSRTAKRLAAFVLLVVVYAFLAKTAGPVALAVTAATSGIIAAVWAAAAAIHERSR